MKPCPRCGFYVDDLDAVCPRCSSRAGARGQAGVIASSLPGLATTRDRLTLGDWVRAIPLLRGAWVCLIIACCAGVPLWWCIDSAVTHTPLRYTPANERPHRHPSQTPTPWNTGAMPQSPESPKASRECEPFSVYWWGFTLTWTLVILALLGWAGHEWYRAAKYGETIPLRGLGRHVLRRMFTYRRTDW